MRNQIMTRHSDPLWNLFFGDFARDRDMSQSHSYDVKETDENYLLAMDLPGIRTEDLKIDLLGKTLSISGERKAFHDDKAEGKKFNFRFTLPERADLAGVQARLEDGVLRVSVPKREEEKPRNIQVLTGRAN